MSIPLSVFINNNLYSEAPIIVAQERPIVFWTRPVIKLIETDGLGNVEAVGEVSQQSYEIRIGSSDTNWGSDSFLGNIVDTGLVYNSKNQYVYDNFLLTRGYTYFGQIRVTDELQETSSWIVFSFKINTPPVVKNVVIEPSEPSPIDNLKITYDYLDKDKGIESGTKVRWFKNGVHQRTLDDLFTIDKSFLSLGDDWSAELIPKDGIEYGKRYTSDVVKILSKVVNSDIENFVKINPPSPTEKDLLTVDYQFSQVSQEVKYYIRWYKNNELLLNLNDLKTVRFSTKADDKIRVEVTPYDDSRIFDTISSDEIIIRKSNYLVYDLKIDGQNSPSSLLSLSPLISWKVFGPVGFDFSRVSVRIGTFYGASNVYDQTFNESNLYSIQVPRNLLKRGVNYYLSVAVSDTDSFNNYTTVSFKTKGDRWNETVSSQIGWTLNFNFLADVTFDPVLISAFQEPTDESSTDDTDGGSDTGIIDAFFGPSQNPASDSESSSTTSNTTSDADEVDPYQDDLEKKQMLMINDGSKLILIYIYANRIELVLGSRIFVTKSDVLKSLDFRKLTNVTICAKMNDIYIYVNNNLYIDASSYYNLALSSKEKSIILGSEIASDDPAYIPILFHSFNYSTSGCFKPESNENKLLYFHKVLSLSEEITGCSLNFKKISSDASASGSEQSGEDQKSEKFLHYLISTKLNENSGRLYTFLNHQIQELKAFSRPIFQSSVSNTAYQGVGKIYTNSWGKYFGAFYPQGVSIFKNYPVQSWNHNIDFSSGLLPNESSWELYQNIGKEVTYFDKEGLFIDTSFENTGSISEELKENVFFSYLDSNCQDCPERSIIRFAWEDVEDLDYDYDDQVINVCSYAYCSQLDFVEIGTDSEGIKLYKIENNSGSDILLSFYSEYGTTVLDHRFKFYQADPDGNNLELLWDTGFTKDSISFCDANVLFENGKILKIEQIIDPTVYLSRLTQNGFHDTLDTQGRARCVVTPCP